MNDTASPALDRTVTDQIDTLVAHGVHRLAHLSESRFRAAADGLTSDGAGLVVVPPAIVKPSVLTPLLSRNGKSGFVVVDMDDLDDFGPIEDARPEPASLHVIEDVERGDDMANWSPDEALAEIRRRGRRPLTISEGISWLLQDPDRLEPNRCFMTIASRKQKGRGLDARTPAIWISNGTGRDGTANRGAPKVGWCWAGNRHTWLGFASTGSVGR